MASALLAAIQKAAADAEAAEDKMVEAMNAEVAVAQSIQTQLDGLLANDDLTPENVQPILDQLGQHTAAMLAAIPAPATTPPVTQQQ